MTVLLTGATGFVGKALMPSIAQRHPLVCAGRRPPAAIKGHDTPFFPIDFSAETDDLERQSHALFAEHQIDVVCHSAGRAHIMHDTVADPLAEFRRINTAATLLLANAAALSGVKRFIYLSSIKVNGEGGGHKPYTANETPHPCDAYGISKYEAELGLQEIGRRTGMEIVIIRPPLVYGPGVKANFQRLLNWVDNGIPLPLKSVNNKRSMVGLRNLIDLILTTIEHPAAAGQIFLVSDGNDLSTAEMIQKIATALQTRARLVPFPVNGLQVLGKLTRRKDQAQRLCSSLQVDITHTRQKLNWKPPFTTEDELAVTADYFRTHKD